jgi:hypothetical protein
MIEIAVQRITPGTGVRAGWVRPERSRSAVVEVRVKATGIDLEGDGKTFAMGETDTLRLNIWADITGDASHVT